MDHLYTKPRVFVSHSSVDKDFVRDLVHWLHSHGFDVWYDDWEITIGDSIVEKVFDGLAKSDALLVVLSRASVASRWVREELDVAVMRRLSENDIRILPVLAETCELPNTLKHVRYADFREDRLGAMSRLLDSLAPGHLMWQSLANTHDHFRLVCREMERQHLQDAELGASLIKLHSLLESALNLRTEIEFRRVQQKMEDLSFFDKISALAEKGLDVRSPTWNALVNYRAAVSHELRSHHGSARLSIGWLEGRPDMDDKCAQLPAALERLEKVMRRLCFESLSADRSARDKLT